MKLLIWCDGGFGNRIGSLLGGLMIAKILNREPVICWPENSYCGASFTDLYENNYEIINISCNELFAKYIDSVFFIHYNLSSHDIKYYDVNLENFQKIIVNCEHPYIIYSNHSIPNFLNNQTDIVSLLSRLKIKSHILKSVTDFCLLNKIDRNSIGIHMRRTDVGIDINYHNFIENFIKNNNNRVFLCSDDKFTEDDFQSKYNVIIHPKNNYVEKKNKDLGWNGIIVDDNGLKWPFNVHRSKLSVIEAFIDLLILSRTSIFQMNKGSTFLTLAKHYQFFENLPGFVNN